MDGFEGDIGTDEPPVYESLYPELEQECVHPSCDNETPGPDRICEKCVPVMRSDAPPECSYCGASMRSDRNT